MNPYQVVNCNFVFVFPHTFKNNKVKFSSHEKGAITIFAHILKHKKDNKDFLFCINFLSFFFKEKLLQINSNRIYPSIVNVLESNVSYRDFNLI